MEIVPIALDKNSYTELMLFKDFYKSVFAILAVREPGVAKVVGTGFVIKAHPLRILTCNHVVGEGTTENNGVVRYSITKRSDNFEDFDLRQVEVSFLRATRITHKPEFDLAILDIDPSENEEIARKLGVENIAALELSFSPVDRQLGADVEWLSTAASGDLTLTPRFFRGNIVSRYVNNHRYQFINSQQVDAPQTITGATLMEVDKLFIPGSSGSPILNSNSDKVIGYVHGFRSWPIQTGTEINQQVELTEENTSKIVSLKQKLPLITSLSLGIDVQTIESYLRETDLLGPTS